MKQFPPSRLQDHAINLKDDFVPKDFLIYSVASIEEKVLKDFIKENLRKGYICLLKSPIALPFFFIEKKDKALRLY